MCHVRTPLEVDTFHVPSRAALTLDTDVDKVVGHEHVPLGVEEQQRELVRLVEHVRPRAGVGAFVNVGRPVGPELREERPTSLKKKQISFVSKKHIKNAGIAIFPAI